MTFSKNRLVMLLVAIPVFFLGKSALEQDQARDLALMELEPAPPDLVPLPPPPKPRPPPEPEPSAQQRLADAVQVLSGAPTVGMDPREEDRLFTEVMAARKTLLAEVEALEEEAEQLPLPEAQAAYLLAAEGRHDLAMSMVELPYPSTLSEAQIAVYAHGVVDKAHRELDRVQDDLERAGEGPAQDQAWARLEGARSALEDQRPADGG